VAQTRKFIDSEGVHWQVYELSDDGPTADPGAQSWLYFFSRGATRSLTTYPDDWSVMDWPGLERLCQHARPPVRHQASRRLAAVHGAEI
jgi:hypothetical protein